MEQLFADGALRSRRASGGAGGRALLAAEPARLRRQQPRGLHATCSKAAATTAWSTSSMHRAPASTAATRSMPFSEHDNVDHPVSLYAATKKANELMAHTYSHLYRLPTTGLRFFTVYGPWGRPDMALFLFTKAILEGRPIDVFNDGRMQRDFTYIDDIADGVVRVLDRVATPDASYRADAPGSGHQQRAVPRVQHRQPHAGAVARVHRLHRTRARQDREQAAAADAGRRRACDLRRRASAARLGRLRPGDAASRPASSASSPGTAATTVSRDHGHRPGRPGPAAIPST